MSQLEEITNKIRDINISNNELILQEFQTFFELKAKKIKEILVKEDAEMDASFSYNKLKSKFEQVQNYNYDNLKSYTSIGTVLCFTNGDPYLVLELIIKAILTKTKIVFVSDIFMDGINTFIVELAKESLTKYQVIPDAISLINMRNYKEIKKSIQNIDCIVINKDYERYKEFHELFNVEIIYLDYGNINVYAEEGFEEKVEELCEMASKEDREIYLFEEKNIKEYLNSASNNFIFHSIVIYTRDIENATYFLKKIKAENVYINTIPFEHDEIIMSEYKFLYSKKIIY